MSAHVYVVDDDAELRSVVAEYLAGDDLPATVFASAEDFFAAALEPGPGCLLTDIRMPGMGGLELQRRLAAVDHPLAVVVMSAFVDVATAVAVVKNGAYDVFEKGRPLPELVEMVRAAVECSIKDWREKQDSSEVTRRFDRLTPRESEVLERIVSGKPNKVIATDLAISIRTVEIHRARVMRKLGAESIADLVRMALER